MTTTKLPEIRAISSKYYFMRFNDGYFGIVPKQFWNYEHRFDDGFDGSDELDRALPAGFHSAGSSQWDYDGSAEDGRQKLLSAGFEELENFFNW